MASLDVASSLSHNLVIGLIVNFSGTWQVLCENRRSHGSSIAVVGTPFPPDRLSLELKTIGTIRGGYSGGELYHL